MALMAGSVIVDDPILLQALPRALPLDLMNYLEGTWTGHGVGEYPPHVPRFLYLQELVIEKAVPHGPRELVWSFRSTCHNRETGEGLQSEQGYLRFQPMYINQGRVELVSTQPSGLAEVSEGTYTEDSLDVSSRFDGLTRPSSASRPLVTAVRRWLEIRPQSDPLTMEYRVEMATERTPMQQHLLSKLQKVA